MLAAAVRVLLVPARYDAAFLHIAAAYVVTVVAFVVVPAPAATAAAAGLEAHWGYLEEGWDVLPDAPLPLPR